MNKRKQYEMVLEHMESSGSITPLEAMNEYGIMRLGARIADLKTLGYQIHTRIIKVPTRYGHAHVAEYSLVQEARS